jgi:ornithine cyclodeaminase
MQLVDKCAVEGNLKMGECIELMEETLLDLARGRAILALRTVTPLYDNNVLGLMPAFLQDQNIMGAKVISVYPQNYQKKLPSHQGVVMVFDARTGVLRAVVDAEAITAIRTAAVSAVATRALSRQDAHTLCLLGAGVQARTHMEAILAVRPIQAVRVWSNVPEEMLAFADEMESKHGVAVTACLSAREAVDGADIICTVTSSQQPVLMGEWIKPGAHINAVGACTARARELDTRAIVLSSLFVDRRESALHEAGDFLIPLSEGAVTEGHILGELGDLLLKRLPGRQSEKEITLFESLGLAVEDIAAANRIIENLKLRT